MWGEIKTRLHILRGTLAGKQAQALTGAEDSPFNGNGIQRRNGMSERTDDPTFKADNHAINEV